MRASALVDECADPRLEDLAAVRLGPGSERQSIKGRRFEGADGGAQGDSAGGLAEDAGRCGRARPSPPRRPRRRRPPGRPQAMASSGTIPKSSTPGISTARQPRYSSRSSSSLDAAEEARPRAGPAPAARALLRARRRRPAAAGRCRGRPRARGRAACTGRGRRRQVVRAGRSVAGGEEVGVDGRRDDDGARGRSSGGCGRPRRRCSRRSGGRGRRCATSQARRRAATSRMPRRASGPSAAGAEVVVVAVPDVPHRRVAVAEVHRPGRGAHALRHAVGARQDEVEARRSSDSAAAGKSGR